MTDRGPDLFRQLTRPDWLPRNQWPFETFAVDMHQGVLAVTEAGRGPTLLLVHTEHGRSSGAT
jgi:hypothetical protein